MIVGTEADLRQAMQLDSETEHVEFKEAKTKFHFEELADYCCALANEGGGSMVLGITDAKPRRIVGTTLIWVSKRLLTSQQRSQHPMAQLFLKSGDQSTPTDAPP